MVLDVAGRGDPLDLLIRNPVAVSWTSDGLQVIDDVLIQSGRPATKIRDAVKASGEITIEAWITPTTTETPEPGPTRIVSLSGNSRERFFTFGQEDDAYTFRLRTTRTSRNGLPALESLPGTLLLEPTHVVFTREQTSGTTRIFLNGRPFSRGSALGDFSGWRDDFHLLLANELNRPRPWQGIYHLVAVYNRALPEGDVSRNYSLGY
jgi:hypothetical protein